MCGKGGGPYIKQPEVRRKITFAKKKKSPLFWLVGVSWVLAQIIYIFFSEVEHLGVGKIWS